MMQERGGGAAVGGRGGPGAGGGGLLWLVAAWPNREGGRDDEERRQLEGAFRRSAGACALWEGISPPDLAYLEEHYGIQIDESRYTVYYDIFGSNLMPDITVLENET